MKNQANDTRNDAQEVEYLYEAFGLTREAADACKFLIGEAVITAAYNTADPNGIKTGDMYVALCNTLNAHNIQSKSAWAYCTSNLAHHFYDKTITSIIAAVTLARETGKTLPQLITEFNAINNGIIDADAIQAASVEQEVF